MARKKKSIQPESEDEVYERFLKKLLKDPRFKQYKPMAIKALAARGFGGRGGRGGGRGGRGGGMIQTPNQDNFTKIHSSILETNSKLADLSSQMKRGSFDLDYAYKMGYFQGMQGNAQPSENIPPPVPANTQISQSQGEYNESILRNSLDLSRDDIGRIGNEPYNIDEEGFTDTVEAEAEQGHIAHLENIPPPTVHAPRTLSYNPERFVPSRSTLEIPGTSFQAETKMYDTTEVVSKLPRTTLESTLKANNYDVSNLPKDTDEARRYVANLYEKEHHDMLMGYEGARQLDLMARGQRGRPLLPGGFKVQDEDESDDEIIVAAD